VLRPKPRWKPKSHGISLRTLPTGQEPASPSSTYRSSQNFVLAQNVPQERSVHRQGLPRFLALCCHRTAQGLPFQAKASEHANQLLVKCAGTVGGRERTRGGSSADLLLTRRGPGWATALTAESSPSTGVEDSFVMAGEVIGSKTGLLCNQCSQQRSKQ